MATAFDIPVDTLDEWVEHLLKCEPLPEVHIKTLTDKAREILIEESNVQPVRSPVTICGDIHGAGLHRRVGTLTRGVETNICRPIPRLDGIV